MEEKSKYEFQPMPRIGDYAPEFTARSTSGNIVFPEDFRGHWVVLFSHPADFTPVCTTEFMMLASMQDKFEEAGCKLIGLSVDSLFSHIAWLRNIKEKIEFEGIEDIDIRFPVIEDISAEVARKYGMIQPNEHKTEAVRAVFFIGPKGKVRAMMYYPLNVGRNMEEIYRTLIALKTAFAYKVSTPANWEPGKDVVISPASTYEAAQHRVDAKPNGTVCKEWFLCMKHIDKEEVLSTVLDKFPKAF